MIQAIRRAAVILADNEIWPVSVAVGLSLVSTRLLPAALGVAAFFWPVRWIACGAPSRRTPADGSIGLLALTIPVTLWATALPETTIPQVYRLATGIALYYAIINWTTTAARIRLVVLGALLAGLALALSAPVSVQWAVDKLPFIPDSLYRRFTLLVSDTINPNVLAGNLILLLPVALALLLFAWQSLPRLYRIVAAAALGGMLIVLVLTLSRGAWMALMVVLALLAWLRWKRGWILSAAAAAVGAILLVRLGSTRILELVGSSSTLGTVDGRIEVWSRAVAMIRDFPFTGVGMGSFGPLADARYPFFSFAPQSVPHAHNLFLQVAVDLGIPGLIAWLAILILVVVIAWQVYQNGRARRDLWFTGLGAGLLCGQVALVVHGMTDAVTWGMVRPAPLVWALWGVAVAAERVCNPI